MPPSAPQARVTSRALLLLASLPPATLPPPPACRLYPFPFTLSRSVAPRTLSPRLLRATDDRLHGGTWHVPNHRVARLVRVQTEAVRDGRLDALLAAQRQFYGWVGGAIGGKARKSLRPPVQRNDVLLQACCGMPALVCTPHGWSATCAGVPPLPCGGLD